MAGGILEVQPDHVTVLSDTAIRGKDLDEEKANAAKAAAEDALRNAKTEIDMARAQSELAVARARKIQRFLSQPFHVAEVFTGSPGKYVTLAETLRGFKMIVAGECDHLPEQAFYMVGTIDEAFEKAKKMA